MSNHQVKIPKHKTKIVCTIGPASRDPETIYQMIMAGMNVARLNFSHGSFAEHKENIRNLRLAESRAGRMINILADLPGAKIRVGKLTHESVFLRSGQKVTLTTKNVPSTTTLIPVEYKRLPDSVFKGGIIYLSDGFLQLKVNAVRKYEVECTVIMGGSLLSRKGMNLPGAKLYIDPVTKKDFELMEFGMSQGIHTFGISFIETAKDVLKFREFAKKKRKEIHLIAKIERQQTIDNFDEILEVSDGIMVARGDLGVEIPIEQVPVVQKKLIRMANIKGIPVITATQMLVSMTQNVRPTRAEVNDVANAIFDGTDAVMLSEETAMGKYPLDAVSMVRKIAEATEKEVHSGRLPTDEVREVKYGIEKIKPAVADVLSLNAAHAAEELDARFIVVPSNRGNTVRRISRFKPSCWILSFSTQRNVCQFLLFSFGVYPLFFKDKNPPKELFKIMKELKLVKKNDTVIITERKFSDKPGDTDSLGISVVE